MPVPDAAGTGLSYREASPGGPAIVAAAAAAGRTEGEPGKAGDAKRGRGHRRRASRPSALAETGRSRREACPGGPATVRGGGGDGGVASIEGGPTYRAAEAGRSY